jgi:photosystem II stability/assembly factor-like uncharacterized protein
MTRLFRLLIPIVLVLFLSVLAGCRSDVSTTSPNIDDNKATSTPSAAASPSPTSSTTPSSSPAVSPGTSPSTSTAPTNNTTGKVTAARLADPQIGWTGGAGWISRTEDGGKSWKKQYQGTGTVQQIFALNSKDAWAVLSPDPGKPVARQLYSTKDGGTNWSLVGQMPNAGFLHFVSADEAFSANARTTDAGKTWTLLSIPDQTVGDAYFHDNEHGWAVTQGNGMIVVNATTDGGRTWNKAMSKQSVAPLNGAVIRSAGKDDAWIELIGESGMSQTSYSLFHTTDGGKQWQAVLANSTAGGGPAPGFPIDYNEGPKNTGSKPGPLYVIDPKVAFMGGYCPACDNPNSIGWTTDAGKTWTSSKQTFPGNGEALLAFADSTRGWWINTDVTEPSVMYTTSDGGKTWTKVYTFDKPKA